MKLIEILKTQGLTDEQINKITSSMRENKVYETSLENADEKYSELKTKKDDLEGQLTTATSTIEGLKKDNKGNETLQQTIKDHETTIETLKKDSEVKIKNLTLNNAINTKLAKVDDKYKKLLETQFDREKLTIKEDGTIEGLEEQYKTISETYTEWFEAETPQNTGGLGNFNRNPGAGGATESLGERLAKQATETNTNHNYFGGAN
jgi:DNA repair exonuclease SbcCD ATPase subunit